jgi:hypothetical protein
MMRNAVTAALLLGLAACGLQDSTTPVAQPDTQIFGRIAAIREVADSPGTSEVDINTGLPVAIRDALRRDGRLEPEMERELVARVRVTPGTVCIAESRAADLDAFRVGLEVAVVPVPGTTTLIGEKRLGAEAAELYRFSDYQVKFMPHALEALPPEVTGRSDAARVNSSGFEGCPVPLEEGAVVYFSAGLLAPVGAGTGLPPRGAVRAGMRDQAGALVPWAVGGYRPYRVAWGGNGWNVPQPVELPGLAADASARVTWVNDAETELLVEVTRPGTVVSLHGARRAATDRPWGELEAVREVSGPAVGDAQRFGRGGAWLVWTAYGAAGGDLWLAQPGKDAAPLDPRINTMGHEWAPRVGPETSLFFCRADRQLLFKGDVVREVRLPGRQRHPLLEAVPTANGRALFARVPLFTPGETDWDLAVAPAAGEGWGTPVALDEWRPR